MVDNLQSLLDAILDKQECTVQEIVDSIDRPPLRINITTEQLQNTAASNYVAPRNALETKLAVIWEEVLGRNDIGVDDNYFELGGKSLMALNLMARVNKELDSNLAVTALLLHSTIAGLAREIQQQKAPKVVKNREYLIPLKPEGSKSPVFCIHAGEGHVLFYKKNVNATGSGKAGLPYSAKRNSRRWPHACQH